MKTDAIAAHVHYIDHLAPIWNALPEPHRGTFYTMPHLLEHAAARGIGAARPYREMRPDSKPALLCSNVDLITARERGRRAIWTEHGAGQTYDVKHPSYAPHGPKGNVILFLAPGPHVADQTRQARPQTPVSVVGCPKLDRWHAAPPRPQSDPPVVAVSFHWECQVCPETRSAWTHFASGLAPVARRFRVIGHAHPSMRDTLRPVYEELGIEYVEDFDEVLARADVYCIDNSSTLFEFASTGRPVVVLNAPWYRRDVRHGLRFWDAAGVGVNCDSPEEWPAAIERALLDTPDTRAAREEAIAKVYSVRDGTASQRAAAAIIEVLKGEPNMANDSTTMVRATVLRTFQGDEGFCIAGSTIWMTSSRFNGHKAKGYVREAAAQAPPPASTPDEKAAAKPEDAGDGEIDLANLAPGGEQDLDLDMSMIDGDEDGGDGPDDADLDEEPAPLPPVIEEAGADGETPTGKNPCGKCGRTFKTAGALSAHLTKKHPKGV